MSTTKERLQNLFNKYQDSDFLSPTQDDVNLLIDSCVPASDKSDNTIRAQALLLLSKFISGQREKYGHTKDRSLATSQIIRALTPALETHLGDTNEKSSLSALAFLSSLFQLDATSATEIFIKDGSLDTVMDMLDLYPTSDTIGIAIADLLSQAGGQKQCINLLSAPQVVGWLEQSSKQANNVRLRAAASVTLAKVLQSPNPADGAGEENSTQSQNNRDERVKELFERLKTVFSSQCEPAIIDAVEAIAYLTIRPSFKELVTRDKRFLTNLLSTVLPSSKSSFAASYAERTGPPQSAGLDADLGLNYGIAVIIMHLSAYRPYLTDEEKQLERLKRMNIQPSAGAKLGEEFDRDSKNDILDDDDHVRERCRYLIDCEAVWVLVNIVKRLQGGNARTSNTKILRTIAIALLNLTEDKTNRKHIIRGGGAKALLSIIRVTLSSLSGIKDSKTIDTLDIQDLKAIQALAKLSITASPDQVYGLATDSCIDGIRPFAILLAHSSGSLLQKFEAIMALTNIASVGLEPSNRVATFRFVTSKDNKSSVGDIIKLAEERLFDNNIMLRRAATELICNLVGFVDIALDYFGGTAKVNATLKLHILIALSDVDDFPTRLAASGALAVLTSSPFACKSIVALEMQHHRVIPILIKLIEDDHEERVALIHRGVICVQNVFENLDTKEERQVMSYEAERQGLIRTLIHITESNSVPESILNLTAQVIKWLTQTDA